MAGTLYLVATPIGNLEDITLRAINVLRDVDLIACEDTRHTRKLLSRYEITKPTISYHEHNERERARELVRKLEAGSDIALVSDAGTPLVSDPGFRLVRESLDRGIRVVPVPGPAAFVAALAASGLPSDEFVFAGFLPPRKGARRARLEEFAGAKTTLIFYEAPHRIRETLEDAREILGDRPAVLARELTKLYEEFLRGSLSEIASSLEPGDVRGEMVLIVGPPLEDNRSRPVRSSILEEIEHVMRDEGLDHKSALKRVARNRGISRSEAYRLAQSERARSDRNA
ncbi:MAG TPA: 16S rRNA (cytidine(1402)-2'-O)-methyltransferase [Blastocatellia bacterium]|nr:16S rRNA (cytidine(1402)-2'-O)-methyltransferase [Blastocatellia bacterium]